MTDRPVQIGEIHTAQIRNKGAKGDGIAKIEGYTIIVPGARIGETVSFKITRALDTYAFAERITDDEKFGET